MANLCDNCGKILDHKEEIFDGVSCFCSVRCQNQFEKKQDQENERNYVFNQMKKAEDKVGKLLPFEIIRKEVSKEISSVKIRRILSYLVEKKRIWVPRKGYFQITEKAIITKDKIEAEMCDCLIRHLGMGNQQSRLFCKKIEYVHQKKRGEFNHHLFFYANGITPSFKIWLPNSSRDKEFDDIFDAMDSCGIKCLVKVDENK